MRKVMVVGIILLFIGASVVSGFQIRSSNNPQPLSRGTWLYVGGSGPGNYTRIQDAINDSADGDTVFVFNESSPYYEKLLINKSINLIGENRESTIIIYERPGNQGTDLITISADNVTIKGFTVQNGEDDLTCILIQSSNCTINGNNIFVDGWAGIGIWEPYYSFNTISENLITSIGTYLGGGGIMLTSTHDNTISRNTITRFTNGIYAKDIYWNTRFTENNISENEVGIWFYATFPTYNNNNLFYNNNLINNQQHVYQFENNLPLITWYAFYPLCGNFWDNYNRTDNFHGKYQSISGSDGIGDIPFNIPGCNHQDRYPLMHPFNGTAPIREVINLNTGERFCLIQEAIDDDDTHDGHTIFLETYPYYESINIHKSVNIIGEDTNTTIIDGDTDSILWQVSADNVQIKEFTLINHSTISIYSDFCSISNTIFIESESAICIENSEYNIIENNIIQYSERGIFIKNSNSNNILNNYITNCSFGINPSISGSAICIENSEYNIIENNIIQYSERGIFIKNSNSNNISYNFVTNCSYGIFLSSSFNNSIFMNNITDCTWSIYIQDEPPGNKSILSIKSSYESNRIIKNNLIGNKYMAIFKFYGIDNINVWDGNFWGQSRFLPKIILGLKMFIIATFEIGIPRKLQFDSHPAKQPYDIPGIS